MPPKKATTASNVYVIIVNKEVHSVHATEESAQAHLETIHGGAVGKVEIHALKGGSVTPITVKRGEKDEKEHEVEASKTKAKASKKAKDDDEGDEAEPAANSKPTKPHTRNPKPKAIEEGLPENVKTLLNGSGTILSGLSIVVTGAPPTLGRQNAERLVQSYGGKLVKSISKNTNYVVVGRDAGPKKLEQIADLGIEQVSEDDLIQMLERGNVLKRGGNEGEKPAAKKAKK
jgi:BRCT domain type II-containing protein